MAYQVKYYKEIDSHGHLWRVEFLQDTKEALTASEIGPVLQSLKLVVQGDQADIDTPIVKTSLEMSFVDAPDLEEERKCGNWEEFYTSNATEYQVRLYKDGEVEWTGFVTPDSFSEELRYRGSISIIARDNLGYMQDFIFDNSENLTVTNILRRGMNKAGVAMSFSEKSSGMPALSGIAVSYPCTSILFNASLFEEKTYYEAAEIALRCSGTVLRYIGKNRYELCAIKDMPKLSQTYWQDVPCKDVMFLAYGHRELCPAAKNISEVVEFDTSDEVVDFRLLQEQYGEDKSMVQYLRVYAYEKEPNAWVQESVFEYAPTMAYESDLWGGKVTNNNSALLNPYIYPYKEGMYSPDCGGEIKSENVLLVAMNQRYNAMTGDERHVTYECDMNAGKVEISMEVGWPVTLYDSMSKIGDFHPEPVTTDPYAYPFTSFAVRKVYAVCRWTGYETDKILQFNGSQWVEQYSTVPVALPMEHVLEEPGRFDGYSDNYYSTVIKLPELDMTESGHLEVLFYGADGDGGKITDTRGMYLRWKGLSIKVLSELPMMSKRKVNTLYSDKNNIRMTRSPEAAIYTAEYVSPKQITNAMYIQLGNKMEGRDSWRMFDFQESTAQPLSVLIHQQLLPYYAKPNNLLSGELMARDGSFPDFRSLWIWNGVAHVLTSGTLNILSGRMENAVLREFKRYDHMWETWAENENIKIDYPSQEFAVIIHPKEKGKELQLQDIPSWLTYEGYEDLESTQIYSFSAMSNMSGAERSAYFQIDQAWVKVSQRTAGDYNVDYSNDYS